MSLYNAMHGLQPTAGLVLGILGFTNTKEIPRFRDAFFIERDGKILAAIRTRTGGGNREDYKEGNEALTKVEGYVSDEDDPFDSTFALFLYNVEGKFNEKFMRMALKEQNPSIGNLKEMTDNAIKALKEGKEPPLAIKKLMSDIKDAIKTAENGDGAPIKIIET